MIFLMSLQESGEMYLETVLVLCRQKGSVRAIDISEYMGYSKPSVSRAVGILKKEGFLTTGQDGSLRLTESGRHTAEKIYERHTVLTDLLVGLGVDGATAAADACRIEHVISDTSFAAIKQALAAERTEST